MATKRHKPEEIVTKLRQVEELVGQGMARLDAIREVRITEQTYYRWRKQYGGMGTDQLKELKRLQKENEQLRKAVSDLTLDKLILTEAARGAEGQRSATSRPRPPSCLHRSGPQRVGRFRTSGLQGAAPASLDAAQASKRPG
jgi:transposase-like protein